MKKLASVFLSVLLALSMAACGSQNAPTQLIESQTENKETISSETTGPEYIDITDTILDSAPAVDTEESEITANTEENDIGSGINPTDRPAAENKTSETTKAKETIQPETQLPVKKPVPAETQKIAETNSPETQKPIKKTVRDPEPPVSVTLPVTQPPKAEPELTQGKILIVYFSWSSNTEKMANTIKEQTGGDLLELIPVTAYPTDYTACTEVALTERDTNARPAIQNLPASIAEYDTILIGYPIWWHTAPMIIGTFLENYDLTGVDVYPFTQSASMDRTQFNNSMEFVRECANSAAVHDGLFARYSDTSAINTYLSNNNLIK